MSKSTKKITGRRWDRIIIFRQGQFGDTLVVFPVIEALNKLFPSAQIVYCTNYFKTKQYVQGCDVARLSPYIDKIATYNVEDSVIRKYFDLKNDIEPGENELLIYLPYSRVKRYQIIRDWVFFRLLSFRNLVCFEENWNWTFTFENKNNILPKESERMAGFIRRAGIPIELKETCSINYNQDWAKEKWAQWRLDGEKVIAICPGSKMQSKRWPKERYIELGKMLHELTDASFVVIGGQEESELADDIISHWIGYGFSCCGASISQTAGILKRSLAYCGNDTGSMHLAALLGIPCVAIFSSREPPALWHPAGKNNVIFRKDVDCRNCNLEKCHASLPLCLEKISVEEVLEATVGIIMRKKLVFNRYSKAQ